MASDGLDRNGDPRLTAFALGELSEIERAEIAARLAESPDERRVVDEIQRLGGLLRQSMVAAVGSAASSELRAAVLRQTAEPTPAELPHPRPRFPRRRSWLPLSLAASLLVISGSLYAFWQAKHHELLIAQNDFIESAASHQTDEPIIEESVMVATDPRDETADPSGVSEPGPVTADVELNVLDGAGFVTELAPQPNYEQVRRPRGNLVRKMGGAPANGDATLGVQGVGLIGGEDLPDDGEGANSYEKRVRTNSPAHRYYSTDYYSSDKQNGARAGSESKKSLASSDESGDVRETQRAAEGEARGRARSGLISPDQRRKSIKVRMPNAAMPADGPKTEIATKRKASKEKVGLQESFAGGSMEAMLGMMGGGDMGGRRGKARPQGMMGGQIDDGAQRDGAAATRYATLSTMGDSTINGQTSPDNNALLAEAYSPIVENPFLNVTEHPLSTFSIDVDTASYANVRRFLTSHALPPPAAVRIEEMINYFQYDYAQPDGPAPFSLTTEVVRCPWNAEHRLLRVGLKGREVAAEGRPASNLVFLLDVSGSMEAPNKLPLVKEAMQLLTEKLTENDRVAIVVYAGNSGLALPSTNGDNKQAIRSAIAGLVANGSTNGSEGLQMAYEMAQSRFIQGGTNRVILATDGDFNVGVTSQDDLVRLIEDKAQSGVFLTALGFGVGNLKDSTLEKLADKGNGNYAYIDTLNEAHKVLAEQLSGTLVTIAKDVKLQIEFNPAQVGEYRLIGYEDRILAHQDFNDDRKDAGEVGAGHTVTALYELSPGGQAVAGVGPLKYQRAEPLTSAAANDELATIKLRYKEPDADESRLTEHIVEQREQNAAVSGDFQFAAAVAAFGMLLRDSAYRGEATYEMVLELANPGLARDANGYRSEFVGLVRQAQEIDHRQ